MIAMKKPLVGQKSRARGRVLDSASFCEFVDPVVLIADLIVARIGYTDLCAVLGQILPSTIR